VKHWVNCSSVSPTGGKGLSGLLSANMGVIIHLSGVF